MMSKVICTAVLILFMASWPAHAQRDAQGNWQLPDYGRTHGVVTEPGMPKCNMAVSEECRRLYGGSRRTAQAPARDYHGCLRAHAYGMVMRGDPRAVRAAETVRARGAVAAVGTEDFRAVHAAGLRACRGKR
jgi:hypothetical protein